MHSIGPGLTLGAAAVLEGVRALADLPRQVAADVERSRLVGHVVHAQRSAAALARVADRTDRRLTAEVLAGDELRELAEALEDENAELSFEVERLADDNAALRTQLAATLAKVAALEAFARRGAQAAR